MRFLLFNVVVLGALFYLFTADRTDIQAATDNAHAVVSRAGNLANQAVDRVDNLMGKAAPEVQAFASAAKPAEPVPQVAAPLKKPVPVASPAASPAVPPAVPEKAVAQEPGPAIQAPPAAPETKDNGRPINAPTRLVAGEIPQNWVPERPAPKVDPAVTDRLLAATDPAGGKPDGAGPVETPARAASASKAEIAIAKGETLMSPSDRRRELATLAEDMELLSLKKLSR